MSDRAASQEAPRIDKQPAEAVKWQRQILLKVSEGAWPLDTFVLDCENVGLDSRTTRQSSSVFVNPYELWQFVREALGNEYPR